jgi:copper chaperone CopZ
MKKHWALFLLILPLLVACSQSSGDQSKVDPVAQAATSVETTEHGCAGKGAACCEQVTFSMPALDAARAGELAQSLASLPGVMKAKPDLEKGQFCVEYQASPANLQAIKAVVEAADAKATLLGVTPVDPAAQAKTGCAGCPMSKACKGS